MAANLPETRGKRNSLNRSWGTTTITQRTGQRKPETLCVVLLSQSWFRATES